MSRKIIESEGRRWVAAGIISAEQYEQIKDLYSDRKHAGGLIPLFGSILVGLGILSLAAANWQEMPELLRLLIIVAAMGGFYGAGEIMLRRGHDKLGIGLIGIGLLTFGAGIVLTAQMFHLEAYDATSWIVWGTSGLLLTYLYRSRYLYTISAVLLTAAQWFSSAEFHQFSFLACAISLAGLGYYALRRQDPLSVWLFSISFITQSVLLAIVNDWKFVWVFIPAALLYTLGDALPGRRGLAPLQSSVLIGTFLFDWFVVLTTGKGQFFELRTEWLPPALPFLTAFAVLLMLSLLLKLRFGRLKSGAEWMLMPVLLYATPYADVVYVIVLFVFSLWLLWNGYTEQWRFKINLGTVLFLISTMTAYGKLTWDFMDKSLFFIVGGILLLALGWFLNRRRRDFFQQTQGGEGHDQVR